MTSDQDFCIEPDCERPTEGYGERCETHTKQFQRTGKCHPIAEKLSPRARFVEAMIRAADAQAETGHDAEFDAAVRTAWNIATREALKKLSPSIVRELLKKLHSTQTKRALREARARGVRLGPPPRVDMARLLRMLKRGDSPQKIAKLLGVTDRWVRQVRSRSRRL